VILIRLAFLQADVQPKVVDQSARQLRAVARIEIGWFAVLRHHPPHPQVRPKDQGQQGGEQNGVDHRLDPKETVDPKRS
jgi:hypothetical protein